MTTSELDAIAEDFIRQPRGRDAGVQGTVRISRQHLLLDQRGDRARHSVEEARAEGRRHLSLDVGVGYKGCFTDSATTVAGRRDRAEAAKRLLEVTQESLEAGIAAATAGQPRRRHRRGGAGRGRGGRVQRRARPRRARDRRRVPRGAAGAELRQAEASREARAGADARDRADGERRRSGDARRSPIAGPSSRSTARCRRTSSIRSRSRTGRQSC